MFYSFRAASEPEENQYPGSYNLRDALSYYGFRNFEQQQALESIFQKASILPLGEPLESIFPTKRTANQLAWDLLTMVRETQRTLTLRTGVQERWEIEPQEWMKEDPQAIVTDLRSLGFIDGIDPQGSNYDAVGLLGSTGPKMQERLNYLHTLMKQGLHVPTLLLISGERYLLQDIDGSEEELIQLAQRLGVDDWHQLTEADLLQDLYNSSPLSHDGLNSYLINTPRRTLPRPTTQTTILESLPWLSAHPEVQNILFISNQPTVLYQRAVIESVFSEEGLHQQIEVVGPPAVNFAKIQLLLEGLGSYLWAATPALLSKMNLIITDPHLKEAFEELYAQNPFIYDTLPKSIRE